MQPTDEFTIETITDLRSWTDCLFSFRTPCRGEPGHLAVENYR